MRKLVLLMSIWSGTALESLAAEMAPVVQPSCSCSCDSCNSCGSCGQDCSQGEKHARGILNKAPRPAPSCSSCDQSCGASGCEKGPKERHCLKIAKWLCYCPTLTKCEKQATPCCVPPMYMFFMCCQQPCGSTQAPACGCAPSVGTVRTSGCQSCQGCQSCR